MSKVGVMKNEYDKSLLQTANSTFYFSGQR